MLTYLGHFAYFLLLCAFVMRDALKLRILLLLAQLFIIAFAWLSGVGVIAGWNVLYAGINAFIAAQILRERRAVVLPASLQTLYDRHFSALLPAEFLRWWAQGRDETLQHTRLAQEGTHPDALYFLLSGTVRIIRDEQLVADLPAGYFVAEMSLLTGQPANANADAVGTVEARRWAIDDLRHIRERNPGLWSKIQSVIGHDLVEKIRRGERSDTGP